MDTEVARGRGGGIQAISHMHGHKHTHERGCAEVFAARNTRPPPPLGVVLLAYSPLGMGRLTFVNLFLFLFLFFRRGGAGIFAARNGQTDGKVLQEQQGLNYFFYFLFYF